MIDYTSSIGTSLEAIVPSKVRRYGGDSDGSTPVASTLWGKRNKKATHLHLEVLPDGWAKIKHPHSGVYYAHKEKGISTLCNMLDSKICCLIVKGAKMLEANSALQALLEDRKIDVVLDVQIGHGHPKLLYYCVSHEERCIFWLEDNGHEEVDIPCISKKCTKSKVSSVHCSEAQYWMHCELFPTTFAVTKEVTGNLKDILLQATADRLFVKFSTSMYGKEDLECMEYMLNVVKDIEVDDEKDNRHSAWIIAKFMTLYNEGALRSPYSHGEDHSENEGTCAGPPIGKHPLMAIFVPFLRGAPNMYKAPLRSLYVSATPEHWLSFMLGINQNLRDSNLLATVLLSTCTALLSLIERNNPNAMMPEQILTYIAIVCSYGSVSVSFAFFKPYRTTAVSAPIRSLSDIKRVLQEPYGLAKLAILFSLPDVLLIWALDAFLVAFCIIIYRGTGIQVRIPVTVALFFVCLAHIYPGYASRPSGKRQETEGREQVCKSENSSEA